MTLYDDKTKRFHLAEAEEKAKREKKGYTPHFIVSGEILTKIVQFAIDDGFSFTRKDKAGKETYDTYKVSQCVGLYVGNAVCEWIRAREAVEQAPEPTQPTLPPAPAKTR